MLMWLFSISQEWWWDRVVGVVQCTTSYVHYNFKINYYVEIV